MNKHAKIKTKLQPHQANAVRRAIKNDILLAHSLGSGKTLSAIAAIDAIGKPATVVTPASLVENFKKELAKHKQGGPPVEVLSIDKAVRDDYIVPDGNTFVVDEAHMLRNQGTKRLREMLSTTQETQE
jgi:superfamily II DNA or RNA helicase